MKRIILLISLLLFLTLIIFAEEVQVAELHFGLGSAVNTMGFGLTSANSVVSKIGDIGFGATIGFAWNIFDTTVVTTPWFWDIYLSYEYPKWFGLFFAYGRNYLGYSYEYTGIITSTHTADAIRPYYLVGLQKTFYFSQTLEKGFFSPGYYEGPPAYWRHARYYAPGTYHGSVNLQIGVRINRVGENITYENYFAPSDINQLYSKIAKDDNKLNFFLGVKLNFDIPIKITKKIDEK